MQAVSVTIGRDRRPDSPSAPLQPLPPDVWDQFRAGVVDALEAIPARETEYREGRTVWAGRVEQCVTVSRLWADPDQGQLVALRARLAVLARAADQDAVVLHVEERELVST